MQLNFIKLGAILLLVSPLSAKQVPANQVQGDLVHDFVDSPIKAVQAVTPWKFMEEMFITRLDAQKKLFAANKGLLVKHLGALTGGTAGAVTAALAGGAGAAFGISKLKDHLGKENDIEMLNVKSFSTDSPEDGGNGSFPNSKIAAYRTNLLDKIKSTDKKDLQKLAGLAGGIGAGSIAALFAAFAGYKVIKYFWNRRIDLLSFKQFVQQWPTNKIATPECFHKGFDEVYNRYEELKNADTKKAEWNSDRYIFAVARQMTKHIRRSIYAKFPKAYGNKLRGKSEVALNGNTYWESIRPNKHMVNLVSNLAVGTIVAVPATIATLLCVGVVASVIGG